MLCLASVLDDLCGTVEWLGVQPPQANVLVGFNIIIAYIFAVFFACGQICLEHDLYQ